MTSGGWYSSFMKLTVGFDAKQKGFALPTILLVSTVLLIILVASIGAAAASRVSLDSQYYNQLAKQAAESGIARAKECLKESGYTPQWETIATGLNLRPDSTCAGVARTGSGVSPYIIGDGSGPASKIRTHYSINAPSGTGPGSTLEVVGTTELVRASSPTTVWRSYTQSLYYQIEVPETIACPQGFIPVPGDSRFGTSDFCVAKYETKIVDGKAGSQASGLPVTNISQTEAIDAAKQACAGCGVITEAQWLTLAHNVVNVASNWSNGTVGSGYIYRGHSDGAPANVLEASSDDNDGYYGTENTVGSTQRRTLTLSNGEVIWDMAGNAHDWTSGQATGGQPGAAGFATREWVDVTGTGTLSPNPFPAFGTPAAASWTSSHGIGRVYSSTSEATAKGFMRGGAYNNSGGVFHLYLGNAPTAKGGNMSFRMSYVPPSKITCPTGFIVVPGNSIFGTNDFCVAKYEAKNVGGVAVSQAASSPWVSISQTDAIIAANAACATCRLISESEWLTIAHDLVNQPGNWTGDSVGNGTVFLGHSDNSPSSRQVASANDSNGYYNTSDTSGDQRRTLTLSNGEVIWDFNGNVFEWTLGQITGGQPGPSGGSYREWNTITNSSLLNPDPSPSFINPAAASWTNANGIGRLYSNSSDATKRAFMRSGHWAGNNGNGLFNLALSRPTDTAYTDTGFRMVAIPN